MYSFHMNFGECSQQRGARLRDIYDLLGGLRVYWQGVTDGDYHTRRKPITLVIMAPSGSLSVECNTLWSSVHAFGSILYFLCADPSSISVNSIVNGILLHLGVFSGSNQLLLHKCSETMAFRKWDEFHSSVLFFCSSGHLLMMALSVLEGL